MNRKTLLIIGATILVFALTDTGRNLLMTGYKKISEKGLDFLKEIESFSSKAYYDVKGWSIGFGHFMGKVKTEDNITLARGLELLAQDLGWAERTVNQSVKVPLTQNQFDALVSFSYNLGANALPNSTLLKKLNAGDYIGAAEQFKLWVHAGGQRNQGLVERREKEYRMFLS